VGPGQHSDSKQNDQENSQRFIRRSRQGRPREGAATKPHHERLGIVARDEAKKETTMLVAAFKMKFVQHWGDHK
jgi:hypothetical protein